MRRRRKLLCSAVLALLANLPPASAEIPIDGRVRDSGGVGLAGVRVELRPILSHWEQGSRELDGRTSEPAAATRTGADGRFELPAPGEGMWEVVVSGDGFVPQRFRLTPLTEAETLIPVRLRRDAGLRVRVEGPDGKPLAGARVVGRAQREEQPGWQTVPRIATSGADGVAWLPASRDERLLLLATAPGFPVQEGPEARGPAEVTLRLAPGTPHRIEGPEGAILRDLRTSLVLARTGAEVVTRGEPWLLLETEEGGRLVFAVPVKEGRVAAAPPVPLPGNVIDSAARQPIAGAWVWPRDDPGRFVRTDAQGAYRLPAGDLEVAAAGHLPEVVDASIPWIGDGIPPVALDPAVALIGTVVDGEGRPAAGAEVAVFPEEVSWFPIALVRRAPRAGHVSSQGEVRIAGLRTGSIQVVATGPGLAPAWLSGGWLKARENRFRLALARGSRVSGRIEDAQGRPVADAEVAIEPGAGTPRPLVNDPAGESERLSTTAADGGFAFADVPAGWHEMTVTRPGGVAQRLPRFEVRGATDLGPLRLGETEVLTARVVDPDGRPVAGAEVWAGSAKWPIAVSGPDGGFSLHASRWQELDLTVCGPGFLPLGLNPSRFLPEETLVLTLRPGASVSGRVTGPLDFPLAGHFVSVKLAGRSEAAVHGCAGREWPESDAAGRFRVAGLEPGLYTIGFKERLALAAGESREIAVPVREWASLGASLSGKLVGSDGLPVPGAVVSLQATEDHGGFQSLSEATSRTDADGRYHLRFPRPGMRIGSSSLGVTRHGRTLITSGFSSWPGPETVEAEARFDIPVEKFPLPLLTAAEVAMEDERVEPGPAAAIAGRILGLEPGELARVKVTAGPMGGHGDATAGPVDPQGSYRLDGLPPGGWWIRAEAADRVAFDSVHIPEGEARITRDLVFSPVGELRGRVETAESEPIAGATVELRHHAGPFEMQQPVVATRTGSDGEYRIRLPVGGYEVTAARQGFVPSAEAAGNYVTVEDGEADYANLWLRPAVALRGRLSGLPADEDEVEIEATRADGLPGYRRRVPGKMIAEGRYVIPGLGPGTWEVEAVCDLAGPGELKAAGRVVIPEEATEAVLELALSRE